MIAVGAVALQAVAFGAARGSLWGFHLPAFLPLPFALGSWAILLATALWVLGQRAPRIETFVERVVPRIVSWPAVLLVVAACGAIFWLWRSQQTVLGDAWPLLNDLPRGIGFHPRQPLGMAFQQAVYRIAGGAFGAPSANPLDVAAHTIALANVLVGMVFVVVAWRLGLAITRTSGGETATSDRTAAGLVTGVLVAQGYGLLFFGYLETYALYALAVALFLLAGLEHLRGRWPLFVPGLVFLLAIGIHMSAVVLAPAFVFLLVLGLAPATTRARTVRDLAIVAAAAVALDRALAAMSPGYSLGQGIAGIVRTATSDQGSGAGVGYLLSGRHLRDFLNEQFLLGPLAAFLFVPAFLFALRHPALRDRAVTFLVSTAALALGSSALTSDPALGYARDWDLFAPVAVACAAAGLALLVKLVPQRASRVRLLAAAVAISLPHLTGWVWLNHSEPRSIARFATLPLGQGRTEVTLGNWHYRNGRTAEAVGWFEKALRLDPRNSNAWAFLGQIWAQEGSMDRAADAFGRASALRPDKLLFRHNYVKALEALGRYADALPQHEAICRAEPELVDNWLGWATALRALGQEEASRAVLEQALRRFEAAYARAPGDFDANSNVGVLLAALDRPEQALQHFQRALRSDPQSDAALYNTGSMLVRLGRASESRPYLERLLQLYPQHPTRDEVRGWLNAAGAR